MLFKKRLVGSIILTLAICFVARIVDRSILFRSSDLIPITVDTEKYVDLLEGRIFKFSSSQYTFYRRLDQTSKKLYIDVFERNGKLLGSSVYELPLSLQ